MKLARAKLIVVFLTAAGFLTAVSVFAFLLVPMFRDIRRLDADILAAHAELQAQYANRKNLLSSLTKSQEARGTLETLGTQFLPPGRELDFITSVETIAARNGVEERIGLSFKESTEAEELRVSFDITLNGSFRSVLQTIVDLERMPTLLIFDSVVVRPTPGTGPDEPSFLSVNIKGTIPAPPSDV